MVKIRLSRAGAKKRPYYRIIAVDERRARETRPLAYLGTFDPLSKPERVTLEREQIALWISRGAQPSPVVRTLLRKHAAAPAVAGGVR